MIHYTETGSFSTYLPEGCKLCQEGAKMVLFVTGLCPKDCFYCPVSKERSGKDVIFANERPVYSDNDILDEARSMNALGTGITGGEPLLVLDRVLGYIELLREHFDTSHHIHLYTSQSPQRDILQKLKTAGLDEIRFHPDIFDSQSHQKFIRSVKWARELDIDVGFEIPSRKGAEHVALMAMDQDIFLNMNELEFSHSNAEAMKEHGFTISNDVSCGALGSQDVALDIIRQNPGLKAHFCSSSFKDAVQLRMRLLRIAKTTAREFDEITPDGTLFYGVIEGDVEEIVEMLNELEVPKKHYCSNKTHVELGWWVLEEISSEILDRFPAWYEESYPTYGRLVVERIPLGLDSGIV
jgi:pyruvate formate-lyase activating enzyme-like uncharacterized protein